MNYRPVHLLLSLLLSLAPLGNTQAVDLQLPELGASAGSVMTPKQERDLGRAFMRSVRRNQAVLEDPLIADYVQHLGNQITQNTSEGTGSFDFFVIDNPQINAFAGPGGHIGVYSGLIMTTETESELAAVLAHEVAHVTQRHLLRAWETAGNMTLPNAAILLAAIALGVVAGGDAGMAAAMGGQAALLQQQINFTRANEKEADRVGIDLLAKSEFEPRAMPAFFARMGKANRVYSSKIPEFLLTHPVTTSRTADALGRAESYPYTQPESELRYQLAKAMLQQRESVNPEAAVIDFDRLLEAGRYRNRAATEFGRALALLRAERLAEADQALQALLEQYPQTTEFVVTKAHIEARRGDTAEALRRLQQALVRRPASYALNVSYAEVALARGEHAKALQSLQAFTLYRDSDPLVHQLMSRAAGESGNRLLAHQYQAEHHYLNGDLEAAILQLEIALKLPGIDFYRSAKLESRLDGLKKEQEEEKRRE